MDSPLSACVPACVGAQQFTEVQRSILLRYFEEFGMVSTHRRNTDLMVQCAEQVGTSLERVKASRTNTCASERSVCECVYGRKSV